MKIQVNAETDGNEIISQYILPQIKNQGIEPKTEEIKVMVWSEKSQKYIDFKPEQVKFIFNR